MKNAAQFLFIFLMMFPLAAYAQESNQNGQDVVDEIIVRGSTQTDPAMSAFLSGDYATAEVEFKQNAFCALRRTRNFQAAVEAARDNSIDSQTSNIADLSSTSSAGQNGANTLSSSPSISSTSRANTSNLNTDKDKLKRTCENRGFQIYMMGMSQLKLGKQEEARKSFSRAVNMSATLFDAHFRLGLMEYQDGNLDKTMKHMQKIQKIENRCNKRNCAAKDEIKAQIEFMKKLLR
jgi:TolA-binding protein